MGKFTKKVVPATAKEVRDYFRANPSVAPEGDKSLGETARGRLSEAAKAVFTENTGKVYSEGNRDTITVEYRRTQPSGRTVKATRDLTVSQARTLAGDKAGKRGILSKAALAAVADALATESAQG